MAVKIQNPYPVFTDIDGMPIEDGYVSITAIGGGVLQAYWDSALTLAATDIRTKGGYPFNPATSAIGILYAAEPFSITVKNRKNKIIYAEADSYPRNRLISVSLASGTWNMAELAAIAGGRATSTFRFVDSGGTTTVEASITMSSSAKTHSNTHIEILAKSGTPLIDVIKIGKSDSVDAAGGLLTIELSSESIVTTELIGNTGSESGFTLITPDQDSNLPDGVTSATFLEAGAELSLGLDGIPNSGIIGARLTDDIIYMNVDFGQIPKQGTGIVLSGGSFYRSLVDGSAVLLGSYTISNVTFYGSKIGFRINQTNIGLGLSANVPIWLVNSASTAPILTIT